MAKKKRTSARRAKTYTKARRRTLSASPRRRRARRRSGLSEIMTPAGAMAAGRGIISGAAGGFASRFVHSAARNQSGLIRLGIGVVVSALTYGIVGPNAGAGMAGGFAAIESEKLSTNLLNEDPYADPDAINQLPPVLNDNGEAMTLMESDGEMFYLDESTGDAYALSEVYPTMAVN